MLGDGEQDFCQLFRAACVFATGSPSEISALTRGVVLRFPHVLEAGRVISALWEGCGERQRGRAVWAGFSQGLSSETAKPGAGLSGI